MKKNLRIKFLATTMLKNKYRKVNCTCYTTSTVIGVITAVTSSSGLAAALTEIGIIAGLPSAGLAAVFGSISIVFTV